MLIRSPKGGVTRERVFLHNRITTLALFPDETCNEKDRLFLEKQNQRATVKTNRYGSPKIRSILKKYMP
jgi:hypothetical protein